MLSAEVYLDCPTLACTKQRLDAAAHAPAHGVLYDKVFVRHWDAWSDGRRSQLFGMALDESGAASGTPVNLSGNLDGDVPGKPFGGREDYAISPDGRQVAFSIRVAPTGEPWSTNFDIYTVAAAGGTPRNLTADNPAWDAQPAFSPDGSTLAYLAMDRPGFEADRFHLVLLNLQTGEKRPLTQHWDRSIGSFAWSHDGKTLFATTDHLGQHPLWADRCGDRPRLGDHRRRACRGIQRRPEAGVLHVQHARRVPRIFIRWASTAASPRRLTHLNQPELAKRAFGEYQQFNFAGANNDNVFGYVVKPANFKRDQKYPVALLMHGGPQGSMANVWH